MTVAILMSTYNGENYLAEQLQSIVRQTFNNWELYIRDDGSTDSTLSIIKEFQKEDSRIHFVDDGLSRLGPSASFLSLILSIDADYYILCDQDDIWYQEKIKVLYSEISKLNNDVPLLIYSGIKTINKEHQHVENAMEETVGKLTNPLERFFWNDMPGCTTMFNKSLKDQLLAQDNDRIVMHDWWLAMIAQTFGEVKFIPQKLIYYRLHDSNSVGAADSLTERISKGHMIARVNQRVSLQMKQSRYFLEVYNTKSMPQKIKKFLSDMSKIESMSIYQRMKFLLLYKPRRGNLADTLSLNAWILLKR